MFAHECHTSSARIFELLFLYEVQEPQKDTKAKDRHADTRRDSIVLDIVLLLLRRGISPHLRHPTADKRLRSSQVPPVTQVRRPAVVCSQVRNRPTPFVNVVEGLEPKTLLFLGPRKPSPVFIGNTSLSVSATSFDTPLREGLPSSDPPFSTPPTPRHIRFIAAPNVTHANHITSPVPPLATSASAPAHCDPTEDVLLLCKQFIQMHEEAISLTMSTDFANRIEDWLRKELYTRIDQVSCNPALNYRCPTTTIARTPPPSPD